MKKISLHVGITILLSMLFTFKAKLSNASHAIGAEFSYVYVGPNVYEITYTFYRDCEGISPSTNMDIQITNECGYPSQTIYIQQFGMQTDVPTTCPTSITECHGGPYTGMQKFVYKGIVTLSGPCVWKIGHGEPARTTSVSTMPGGGTEHLYVFCMIDNTNGVVNNSPVFYNEPVLIHSINQLVTIENSVYDIENDSLVFELIPPRWGPNIGDTLSYFPTYSYSRPFISSTPITLNQQTGLIEGNATQVDITIYALLISEYRNGTLIGQIERDMNISFENAVNVNPQLTGFFGTPIFTMDVYAGQQNCFQITAADTGSNSRTEMDINCSIPGMSYYESGWIRDTGFFCWTPMLSDTINNPYCFTVSVMDNYCPFFGYQARSYCINVQLPVGIDELNSDNISIYPNPFNSEITIKSEHPGKSEFTIFDMQGRKIASKILDSTESVHNFHELENGIYIVSVSVLETNQVYYQRMLKVNLKM